MSNRTPQFRRYRGTYARVKLNGRWVRLGPYDSPESKARYKQLIAQWAAESTPVPTEVKTITVAEVLEAYRLYAKSYYGEDRESFYGHLLSTIRTVRELYADLPAGEFTPKKLKVVRQAFVNPGFTRGHVNQCTQRVVSMFRWAAEEELVPGSLVHDLQAVQSLRRGHSEAPEGKVVTSVPQATVDATLPFLVPVVRDMICLQLVAGCRPCELCTMTW